MNNHIDIPAASEMLDIASISAIASNEKIIPRIMEEICEVSSKGETNLQIGNLSALAIDILIPIFKAQGYSAQHGSDGWGNPGLEIIWG